MSASSWQKVLYISQKYPDNYTDKYTFLRDLKKNIDFQEVSAKDAILATTVLTREICNVVGFVLIYVYLYNEWVDPELVFAVSSALTIVGFLLYRFLYTSHIKHILGNDLRTVLIFVVFGQLFSPILHTLTDTISTDSIYTMTFFMMLVHIIFFDYGVNARIVSNSLSLNAAIFAVICLSSRLSSSYHAFILITMAVECFVLFPVFREKIKNSLMVTICLVMLVTGFLMPVSNIFTILFVLTLAFINLICPLLFVKYQKYKENIYGPWDEAVVEDVDNVIF